MTCARRLTNSKTAVVLVKGNEVECGARHGGRLSREVGGRDVRAERGRNRVRGCLKGDALEAVSVRYPRARSTGSRRFVGIGCSSDESRRLAGSAVKTPSTQTTVFEEGFAVSTKGVRLPLVVGATRSLTDSFRVVGEGRSRFVVLALAVLVLDACGENGAELCDCGPCLGELSTICLS